VFLWKGIIFAGTSWAMLERTPSAFNFYVFPAKTLLPLGIFLLFIQGLSDFIKNIVFLAKGEQL
jgi:TRAP-type mannitol/chloroaromatic compound transport system permease small subunit